MFSVAKKLFNNTIGNLVQIDVSKVLAESPILFSENEKVILCYKQIRDALIITDKRIIKIDKQGVTGKKVEIMSIPYKAIHKFSVETTGHMDLDSELKLWVAADSNPVKLTFAAGTDIQMLQRVIAEHI
ncbi:PH domain-containing protein [Photobacterium damselae]|uniref:PH domain-containing protein n=1 Tax=Photobacterium damselae TaxID=38293 RepID=UPI004068AF92